MERHHDPKFHEMTESPVGPLICRMAVPCIISMLITAFYNMADTFFVGQMDSNAATGAVGVVFSMMAIIQAVGFFFGHGSGNFISRELGRQNREEASYMAATGFFASMAAGLVICLLGLLFLEPLAYLLGSTDTILPHAKAYMGIVLLGAPWMTASMVLNNQLRFQGNAVYGMVGITCGALLNIVLDPIMIFGLGLGVAGAAWATIIGQLVSFFILLAGCQRRGSIPIRFRNIRLKWYYYSMIIRGGLPSLARQGLASVAAICLNQAAGAYGDAAIAAMGVVQRIMMFGTSAMIGFGQGFQPMCGYNYGAKYYGRVREGFWFCVKTATGFLAALGVLGFLFAPQLVAVFRDDPQVIDYGATALRFQCVIFCAMGVIIPSNMMLQTIGKAAPATFLAVARQGLFFIPLVWILSAAFGMKGIQMTQAAADLLTLLCTIPIQRKYLRELTAAEQAQKNGRT